MDEEIAWSLVRAAVAYTKETFGAAERATRRIQLPVGPVVWIDIDSSGGWRSSAPPNEAARHLLDLYVPLTLVPDLVIGQLGQSLDGRIATASGDSHFITGPADIRRLHRLRALVDAVVVGAGTVAADDPQLTVREVEGENPVRVVLDPDSRLTADHKIFSDGAARTLIVRGLEDPPTATSKVTTGPIAGSGQGEIIRVPNGPDGLDPSGVMVVLRHRGLRRVLIEGGGVTVSRFLQAGLLDRLHVTVAPMLIGSGRPAFTLPPIESLDDALRPKCRHVRLGKDLLFDLDLR